MPEPTAAKRAPDPIYDSIGEVGKWQVYVSIVAAISKFPVGWLQLSTVFLAPPAKYHCVDPSNSTDPCSSECNEVEYDRSIFEETIITEWDLICTKSHLANWAQTIYVFGMLVGNVSFGVWSDKSPDTVGSRGFNAADTTGVSAAFSPWFWLFVFLRFLCAVASGGSMMAGFCLVMEIIGPSHREVLAGTVYMVPFNMGVLLLAPFAYFIRHFREYQFTLSIFSVLLTSYICLIPESPRWLLINGHFDESVKVLEKAAMMNGMPTENIRKTIEDAAKARPDKDQANKGSVFDLLRTPKLRRNTLCVFYNWFAAGFNFFGVSQYVGHLGGNIFVNVALSALCSLPGLITATPACKYLGRKPTLIAANLIVVVSMLTFIIVPEDPAMLRVVLASISVFGASMQLPTVYLYAGEIFPTVARNAGSGVASMQSRVGAMIAAQVARLKEFGPWIAPSTFALCALIGMVLALFLPETRGEPLPETLEDAENFGKKNE